LVAAKSVVEGHRMSNRRYLSRPGCLAIGLPLAIGALLAAGLPSVAASGATVSVACDTVALVAAINAAYDSGPTTLSLADGCHYDLGRVDDSTFGNSGTPVITNPAGVTIQGNGATIDRAASATDDFRILTVGPGGALAVLNTTIAGGRSTCTGTTNVAWCTSAASTNQLQAFGGGIGVLDGFVSVVGSTLSGNTAACVAPDTLCTFATGGAIGGQSDGASPAGIAVTDTTFTGNQATCSDTGTDTCTSAGGGAVMVSDAGLFVLRSTFTQNSTGCTNTSGTTCSSAEGGAVAAFNDAPFTLNVTDSKLTNNIATSEQDADGGAVAVVGSMTAALTNDTISNNTAASGTAAFGGGVFSDSGGTTINTGSLDHNTAGTGTSAGSTAFGGGLYTVEGETDVADVLISANTVQADDAYGGGAAEDEGANGGILKIERGTVSENTATGGTLAQGAGVGVFGSGLNLHLAHGTVSKNQATAPTAQGGGIFSSASALDDETIKENKVVGSTSALGGGLFVPLGTPIAAVTVAGGKVDSNQATTTSGTALGAGIYNGGTMSVTGKAAVTKNAATAGTGGNADGGGIETDTHSTTVDPTVEIAANTPDGCAAVNGGTNTGC
jgi:hypothetical protein